MTEAEWENGNLLGKMLDIIEGKESDRKLRLFACACSHLAEEYRWAGEQSMRAMDVAERYADQIATEAELEAARMGVRAQLELFGGELVYDASFWACSQNITEDIRWCVFYAANMSTRPVPDGHDFDERCNAVRDAVFAAQAVLLRDIFGNPFRPVTFDPVWRTSTVLALAQQIYDSREFSAMPILADALQDAGCDNDDVLNHCRGTGPHVRGCWVVDLVLGKT